jgi:spore germination protein GerM
MLVTALCSVVWAATDKPDYARVKIYVVDEELMGLIPLDTEIIDGTPEFMARQIINRLIKGYDDNKKIRRLIPADRSCLSVSVSGNTANVNIRGKLIGEQLSSKELEKLFVYQIVNSLASVDRISRVNFTVEGKQEKRLAGFVDMRETFVPDYTGKY